ncbi:MAG: hypothetical protein CVU56_05040 [Deltaproteobacteria bacterium HGW-Deltaproteobacteria-14]|nr:MAG: hypothetical protein CVU56_05040 [Deltaproteobacteria bacterium HGW-Deltaproteobacteria-14]
MSVRLGAAPGDPAAVVAALAETQELVLDRMDAMLGTLRPGGAASPFARLSGPADVVELLACAIGAAEGAGERDHADGLRLQYLEALPAARLDQLVGTGALAARVFHTPAPWPHLRRFRRGLDRLFDRFAAHRLDPERALGAVDAGAYCARFPTLADWYVTTYWGGLEPMFQALPHDLAASLPGDAPEEAFWAAVDHRLALSMLHEILHFAPARETLLPPYLDEALAGWFGVVLDEAAAFPAPGDDDGLAGWPWFAQVGEALCRAFGEGPVLAAQAGLVPWDEVLPAGLPAACARLGWAAYRAAPALHLHPDVTRPDRWVRLFYAAAAGRDPGAIATLEALDALPFHALALPARPRQDARIVYHALSAMCLEATQVGASWRVRRAAPAGPVIVDFARGEVSAPARPAGYELAPARYALPPLGRTDRHALDVSDVSPAALAAAAERLLDAR